MTMKSAFLSVLACLQLVHGGKILGDASANYTQQLLNSGTIDLGDWKPAYEKAAALVKTLTFDEKVSIVSGSNGGSFNALQKLDSSSNPLGYYYVTTWPAGLAMSMTWDRKAIYDQGKALGKEFKGKGINLAYAPTMEPLGRSAWCGRTGESYGPDSYHAGSMGGYFVKGMADAGVIPSSKHLIMNEYETNRMGRDNGGGGASPSSKSNFQNETSSSGNSTDGSLSYSVHIDDKAFHETYLAPFYDAVKNGVGGTMCAMNRVNGTYSCESQDLLAKYLKVELGFPGMVNADVNAQHTAINAANAGMDISSESLWTNTTLLAAIANGTFTQERLDDMVVRNMIGYFKYNQDKDYPPYAEKTDHVDPRGNHAALARTLAANSIALLKNTNNALPLKNKTSVSIFGYHASPKYVGASGSLSVFDGVGPTMLGHMYGVGGSAMGTPPYLVTPVQVMNERAAKTGIMLRWWLRDETDLATYFLDNANEISESTKGVAINSDACIVYLNAWAGEGADRIELTNGTQDVLVNAVADVCNNTIVVINTVGPRLVDQWIEHENVTGVLYAGPLGQESGYALDDVLFGAVNPSGRLVHTIAKNESDYDPITRVSQSLNLNFTEGNYIDYKYFDKNAIEPRFEFGYGLSYTSFEYSSTISVSANVSASYATGKRSIGGRADLWDTVASVSGTLKNTGDLAGAEVAQLYVQFPEAANEPVRQIRGFEKVTLQPGEQTNVEFTLKRRDLSVWDVVAQEWKIEAGEYTFYYGASSRDFKATATLTL
ncbi:hypothetical protein TD95_004996 [Thielaviopsis punctulata]|uniref:beta-glucosidase n=1 Tax=Thielaviopsis punctulata TaxID=72032 RepID=A0A0F4ZJR7_9PEZI|nr:hypothetical protein TD95_004996 [Thielaviopsis punctulata]